MAACLTLAARASKVGGGVINGVGMKKYSDAHRLFEQLVFLSKQKSPVPLERVVPDDGLKMVAHHHPWSLKPREFDFIRSLVASYDLRCGFEIATAFGISGLAAALGFKQTGGKLVTMDAYVEEAHESSMHYMHVQSWLGSENADGYKSVGFLREWFALDNHLVPTIGWSPTDVGDLLRTHHGANPLDFVFIDGGHWDEALIRDLGAVSPFLADRAIVVFHDTHCFGAPAQDYVQQTLGASWTVPPAFQRGEGWYLGYVARGFDVSELAADYQ